MASPLSSEEFSMYTPRTDLTQYDFASGHGVAGAKTSATPRRSRSNLQCLRAAGRRNRWRIGSRTQRRVLQRRRVLLDEPLRREKTDRTVIRSSYVRYADPREALSGGMNDRSAVFSKRI